MKWLQIISKFGLAALVPTAFSIAASACGNGDVCKLPGRHGGSYHIAHPAGKPQKIFVFFHGHNGSGAGVMRNRRLIRTLHQEGYLVVAPDGPEFAFAGRTTRGWAARPEGANPRGNRDDILFVEKLLIDVADRFDIDVGQTVVSGFSSGGSMAWYFSCYSKMPLVGVVAVAGGLRRPLPVTGGEARGEMSERACPGGARNLIHIHGFSDRQVPLEGRAIRSWHQGDVFESLAIQRKTNQCESRPDKIELADGYWCREWSKCASQMGLRLCLHAGGHGMPKNWLAQGLEWLGKAR